MIFVDTWAWLALAHKHDPYHASAGQVHRRLQKQKAPYLTTDHVLSEAVPALFSVVSFTKARRFMLIVFESARAGRYQLVFVSPEQFERAWQLRERYQD